jgi:hypothetical protein
MKRSEHVRGIVCPTCSICRLTVFGGRDLFDWNLLILFAWQDVWAARRPLTAREDMCIARLFP